MDRDESSVWYEAAEILPKLTDSNAAAPAHVLETKTTVAQKLIETEADSYQKKLSRTNPADASWLQTVLLPHLCPCRTVANDNTVSNIVNLQHTGGASCLSCICK